MNLVIVVLVGILLIVINVYFTIAMKTGLVDVPNHRSSHKGVVVRGGGIIIPFGLLFYTFWEGTNYLYFIIGLVIISIISFFDDLGHLNPMIRISGQAVALFLLLYEISNSFYLDPLIILLSIIALGTLNAYNFMDGINGIMISNSLVFLTTLILIESAIFQFTDIELLNVLLVTALVFGFYNFRNNARCFAGDVGSVSMAFICVFFIAQLISQTGTGIWILLLAVFGIDSVLTIVNRIRKKENIFKAHRSHLYQYYANVSKVSQLKISIVYASLQLFINFIIVFSFSHKILNDWILATIILAPMTVFFIYRIKRFESKLPAT